MRGTFRRSDLFLTNLRGKNIMGLSQKGELATEKEICYGTMSRECYHFYRSTVAKIVKRSEIRRKLRS